MKFLFIVQGEGRGHLTQAITLEEILLRNGHEVVEVLVGKSSSRRLPDFALGIILQKPFPARTALCRGSLAASAESFEPIFAEGAVQWVRTHEMVAQGDGHTVRSVQSPERTSIVSMLLTRPRPAPWGPSLGRDTLFDACGGVFEYLQPAAHAAAIATPCARPSLGIDCTFSPKKGDSRATSRGRYSSTRAPTRSKM